MTAASRQGPQTHIVVFREAPLASYRGERTGLAAPPKLAGKNRVNVKSAAARAYVSDLTQRQQRHETELSARIGRPLKISQRMQHALNAVVTELSPAEAAQVKQSPDVLLVEPYHEYVLDTDAGPALIGAPDIWSKGVGLPPGHITGTPGPAKGEGVVFGILDSGINFGSPSFAAVDSLGYPHVNPLGAGNHLGTCAPGEVDEGRCNDKLIGGYDFVCEAPAFRCGVAGIREEPGFGDTDGHGSHTASTAAGNHRDVVFRGVPTHISGVAPRANIVAFDICYHNIPTGQGLCPNVSAVAAINQAIADGVVDVINYSIGGGASPWTEAVSLAFLNASDAGIYIAASAGNSGPGAGTLGHNEPWTSSTAAATHTRLGFEFFLDVTGPAPVPSGLESILLRPGVNGVSQTAAIPGTTPLVVSPGIDTGNDGCAAFAAGQFQDAIAVIRRGTCAFSDKTNNAEAAGAIAVVIANNAAGITTPSVPGTSIPAFMVFQDDGDAVRDFAAANPGTTTAAIDYPATVIPGDPDVLAAFSSRGPAGFDLLKPDLTAPGVAILATIAGDTLTGFEDAIGLISGTSMASPHQAGAAGLLRQLHPTWSVPEIKSALVMTGHQDVLLEDGQTPANAFARGGGRVEAYQAARAGLVLHETTGNYLAANPNSGGDPSALNQPAMSRADCTDDCTFTRTFRSTRKNSQAWIATLEGLPGSVSPAQFNIKAFGERGVHISIDNGALPADGSWQFGTLVLTPEKADGANASPVLRLPIAVAVLPPPVPLENGVPVPGLADTTGGELFFTLEVPDGANNLSVTISGGSGDADLYVRHGERPNNALFDCRPFLFGNNEACNFASPQAGTWWIRLQAFSSYDGVTLTATWN
uniref:S8 family serine peptidase n=1 Tax=Marilutibacter alkalisoli TaxID=2591633 RepID=UPI001422511C|nr:S8 family serine peptidase [Lysobacter alkalisoli]